MQDSEARGASSATDPSRIVFGVDERYVDHMLVAITSLVADGGVGRATPVTVVHCELSPATQARIRRVAAALDLELHIAQVAPRPERFPLSGWITPAAYLRLRLAEAGIEESHALYLDCDLIATGDITELVHEKPDAVLAAAGDLSHPLVGCGEGLPGYEQLGVDGSREYFNSGVLVIDTARWVRDRIAARCTEFLVEQAQHVAFWDQDALNYVLDDRWQRLAPRFNTIVLSPLLSMIDEPDPVRMLPSVDQARAQEAEARILHFAGPLKPWNPSYPDGEPREHFERHRETLRRLDHVAVV